ncbi:MAG TPA: metallophosphoesterase [Pedobacter sp.]|uniref:metallophosphoesterase n=1 Tax=Pedobacter sp. TaxID=1411316 RepID=UPI002BAE582C|nr:metallophosphoesterase [Pedobacter sp.]HMI04009.1 metallophosphoesterase [Pedobacter sp.]
MNFKIMLIVFISLSILFDKPTKAQKKALAKAAKIILEIEFDENFNKSAIDLKSSSYDYVGGLHWKTIIPKIEANQAKYLIISSKPVWINLNSVLGSKNKLNLYEPGDSIHLDLENGELIYSGRNSDKFKMLQELKRSRALLKVPNILGINENKPDRDLYKVDAVQEYLKWSSFFDDNLKLIEQIFQSYQNKISAFAFGYLKADLISDVEYERLRKFGKLRDQFSILKISPDRLGQLFDSTAYNNSVKWLHSYTGKTSSYYYYYDFVRKSVERKYNFNSDHELFKTAARKVAYADLAKNIYSGDMLQGFFVYLLTERGLKEHTYGDKQQSPEIEHLLKEFYKMPGYPAYKTYVKGYEQMIREWAISVGHNAPAFNLMNERGNLYTKKDLKGKVVMLNFLDDSMESGEMAVALKKMQLVFERNRDVLFVNVFVERDKMLWNKDMVASVNGIKNVINLYINDEEKNNPILKYYNVKAYSEFGVKAYPKIFLLNSRGQFVFNGEFMRVNGGPLERITYHVLPDPLRDNGACLISEINKQLALMKDGPYVFHTKDSVILYQIKSTFQSERNAIADIAGKQLNVQTDRFDKIFKVNVKSNLSVETDKWNRPMKLFVLSDIEGNFAAFRKLLQSNKIIDDQFNWIFGKGHLVFAGDMFDRGVQVTECLWLVYMLEEKAKAAGGYMHFVLGNHEIMNLQGDHRYVEDKYKGNAALMGKTLAQLYNEDSELGRWLRTKNIVEKIGDLLLTHGGISNEMSNLKLPVGEINQLARPNYANKEADYKDVNTRTIMSSKVGPFWYRGYYDLKSKVTEAGIDSILRSFDVKHIITGHTIIADTISTHYSNKVINTDTKHKDGKSEALLIEDKNFYRVNAEGKRVLLFKEEEK